MRTIKGGPEVINNIAENIIKCAGCNAIKINDVWEPNIGILSEENILKCPTVVCLQCQPKK